MPTSKCPHSQLAFSPSRNASTVKYEHPSFAALTAATTSSGTEKKTKFSKDEHSRTFPAPLVLPNDELSYDPSCPPQSLRSWIRGKHRNKVTPERKTIYFIPPPEIGKGFEFIKEWTKSRASSLGGNIDNNVVHPKTRDILDYLQAFYHGMEVKLLTTPKLEFTADPPPPPNARPKRGGMKNIWINTPKELVGIRMRATPEGAFTHQLNLSDLLDAVIEILPEDAYALVMLVEHDIFEDEEDDFACGRAYGGSRVAVVSSARYNPGLDAEAGIEREHSWPASHCRGYLDKVCDEFEEEEMEEVKSARVKGRKQKKTTGKDEENDTENEIGRGPLYAALKAHSSLPSPHFNPSPSTLYGLWLGRVCRTAGHELGHCFGIGHCTYYACSMQGTASIIEDPRQPPYLCPVDLEKVVRTTGADVLERYETILAFCDKFKRVHLFVAYGAWIRSRIEEITGVVVLD